MLKLSIVSSLATHDGADMGCLTFADCRLQTADRRPQTVDRRLQTADCRLQTADCRLHVFHSTQMEMNLIMEDTSSLRYGYLVHYYCMWCTSIHRGYISNFAEGKWFCQGLFRTVYMKGGCPSSPAYRRHGYRKFSYYSFQIT